MPYTITKQGNDVLTLMEGVLSFHQHKEADEMVNKIGHHLDDGAVTAVRFDLAKVYNMDSHWLGIIIRVLRRCREKNIPLIVEKPSTEVKRLFEVVQMDKVIQIK